MSQLVVPNGWDIASLVDHASIGHGFAFKSEHFRESGDCAVTTPGNFYEEGGFRNVGVKQRYYGGEFPVSYLLQPGDLIVAMTEQAEGLLGSAAIVPGGAQYLHNQRIGRVRCDSNSTRLDFLYWLFNSRGYRAAVRETAAGTKVKHTSPSKLLSIPVPIPPVGEQERIADVLSTVASLCTSLERLIAKKRAMKQGMMQQLLTGKTRLPGFADPWKARRISDFAEVRAGGTPSTSIARYWGGTVRWMSSGEIHSKRVDEVQGRITAEGLRESSAQLLPVGTVLMALAGQGKTRGTVAVSRIELSTNQSIAGILPGGQHDPGFLYYNLDTRYVELRGESPGEGGRGGLNLTIIKKLEVLMPNVVEQQAIAKVLTAVDDEIDDLERRLVSTRRIKQGMMQELLSGRTRLKSAEVAA